MTSNSLRKPVFWIVLLIASALCAFTVFRYFGDAFSVLDLDVRMSRTQAIAEARRIVDDKKLSTAKLTESAASFSGDTAVQTFIELEGGGKPALKPLLGGDGGGGEYTLYKWRVRLYSEGVEREVLIAFTPDGRPSGFFSKLPEAEPGRALAADEARAIAVDSATRDWAVDFARYRPLTASSVMRPGKRVDHEFIYERKLEGAPPLGEGRLRLRLVVSGDRLTHLQRFVFVPEAFARRYETLRSANNTIAAFASVGAGLLYGLGGCLIGLIWLMRRHAVHWGPAAKWAAVVAVLIGGAGLAGIPASWLDYDTATSASTHLITRIGGAVVGAIVTWLLLTVVFATAEGLGRLAFGSHPQLWRTWRTPSAISRAVWGRTLAGYAWIGFDLAFIAAFYFLVQRYLGWWSPSDALIDPNILGTPQPWIPPVAMSLQAGMMEESLFRAVPLAGAALLGRHFGRERLFIVIALVLQAIIFGCAHANYPGQPAYARPVELFLPSLVWGLVYLRYGLVPGMLFHFGFDLVLMAIPLFVTDVPGIVFDRAMVIAILLIPIGVLIVQRLRAGRLIDLPDSERNAAAPRSDPVSEPMSRATDDAVLAVLAPMVAETAGGVASSTSASPSVSTDAASSPTFARGRLEVALLVVLAVIGAIGLTIKLARPYDAPGLAISRDQAIVIAERALTARGVTLDPRWRRSAKAVAVADPSVTRFVWREGGESLYARLIGNVLPPPHWEVRFARFDGDVAKRESWRVVVVDDRAAPDGIRVIEHDIPEGAPGKRLAEADARAIAERAIDAWFHLPASGLRPVSAEAIEKPSRVDWVFIYANPAVILPAGGEARIVIEVAGDQVVSLGRTLFVPDAWTREERHRNEMRLIPRALLGLIALAFVIALLVSTVRRLARGEASRRAALVGATLTVVAVLVGGLLDLDASQFGFSIGQPFDDQMLRVYLKWLSAAAAAGLFAALFTAVGVRIVSRAERLRPASQTPRRTWATAIAIAASISGIGGIVGVIGTRSNARVPEIGNADSFVPLLSSFVGGLDFVAATSVLLIAAALLKSRRRWIEVAIAPGFVLAAMLGAAIGPETRASSIAVAALAGALAWWIYRRHVREREWIVAPLAMCLSLLSLLPALMHATSPHARSGALAGAVGLTLAYAIWRWLVQNDRARKVAIY